MARSLIGGLIADGCAPDNLWVSEPDPERLRLLTDHADVHVSDGNVALAAAVNVVVLAVKPQVLCEVCKEIAETVRTRGTLLISVAAGVRVADMLRWLGGTDLAVVRTMPNTPALVQSGATALCANAQVTAEQRELAEAVMRAVGLTLWLDEESQMDAVTALSGSGPAYFFLVMEALEQAGCELGLPSRTARLLALQTAFGAAKMALESAEDTATLRERVTSPGGTTERALRVLEDGNLRGLFREALQGARDRSRELAEMLGGAKG